MRFLVVGDVHISQMSSMQYGKGKKYSKRLENCIDSINWAEQTAEENKVDKIIYIGDLFDHGTLNAEEVTALQEIQWANVPHVVLVGNHELGNHAGTYSTAHLMKLLPNFEVIDKPFIEITDNAHILYLPYIFEEDRKTLKDYNYLTDSSKKQIIISHNDIADVMYGAFLTKMGFKLDDIKDNCDLFINGHIHNGQILNEHPLIVNIGNLTGQTRSEDAEKYEHHVIIFDDTTLKVQYIENPHACNIYNFAIHSEEEIDDLQFKNHAAVHISCPEDLVSVLKAKLRSMDNVDCMRVETITKMSGTMEAVSIEDLHAVDYLEQFRLYIKMKNIGSDDLVDEELQEVIGCE